ncbi:MAG: acetyl-CoA carboxylase biotin carboxyl carrier protein [Alphaproteobacteria bacterium]|nr:acetyl-CoA carboxylase biotin carboxyl carrier protein [Alphaproteobacteria bacterium]MBU0796531.1 acetyl-CoA carboxylase biotin carboxyl carrier protein [Alphaproteobacteria bacterium]MBU0885691.1 acetyl-CoA carboxylase biotin carboxyl carrier protein [Alphaproteobacteria bacterium]MBU1811500.1 acetyl-CoA carboxylase biotin carboxyl carrier protein [Alphaproteobacteria bacterium]
MTEENVKIDAAMIREIAALLEETGLGEIEYETGDIRIRVAKPMAAPVHSVVAAGPAMAQGGPVVVAPVAIADNPGAVPSPMVGTAYLTPEPGAEAFVKIGDNVRKGQTIAIVEAMKVMNPIHAPRDGTVTSIFIENGQPVEFGEPMMVIE